MRYHRRLDNIPDIQYPPRYHQLIHTQNTIGWGQVYKGRWSKEWGRLQAQYTHRNALADTRRGHPWALTLGRLMIDQWLEVWSIRNNERHGKDKEQYNQVRLQAAHAELTALYRYKDQVCPSDRSLFYESVEEHLFHQSSIEQIEEYIKINRAAIKASVNQANSLRIPRNRTLLEYPMFNPITRPSQQASLPAGLSAG